MSPPGDTIAYQSDIPIWRSHLVQTVAFRGDSARRSHVAGLRGGVRRAGRRAPADGPRRALRVGGMALLRRLGLNSRPLTCRARATTRGSSRTSSTRLGIRESGDLAALRRLFFEAYSFAVADLKRKVEQSSDDLPRRIPIAERRGRRLVVERRLVGISLTRELDVSTLILDAVIQPAEGKVLRYIPWEECTARALELNGVKKDPAWTTDTAGHIKAIAVAKPLATNADSELKLHVALKRRGLAFEMGDLLQFELHGRLVEKMIAAYMRPAIGGHKKVDVAQIERADKEAFRLLAERTRGGIRRSEVLPCGPAAASAGKHLGQAA